MTQNDVRALVIDWLYQHAPGLLADDVIPEGLIFLCNRVWVEARREEQLHHKCEDAIKKRTQ